MVGRRVVATQHGGPLAQAQLAGAHVIAVHRSRSGQRGVAQAHHRLVELRVPAGADRVDLVVEADLVVLAHPVGAKLEDAELGEPLAALVDDEVPGEGIDVIETDSVVVDRKSTRLNSSHYCAPRMPSSARKK